MFNSFSSNYLLYVKRRTNYASSKENESKYRNKVLNQKQNCLLNKNVYILSCKPKGNTFYTLKLSKLEYVCVFVNQKCLKKGLRKKNCD